MSRYCPASVELWAQGRRRVCLLLPTAELCVAHGPPCEPLGPALPLRLRTYSELARALPLLPVPRMHKNRRLALQELRRRQVTYPNPFP